MQRYISQLSWDHRFQGNNLTQFGLYCKIAVAWSRGVVAEHAALSRPRSRVRIPSGPLSLNPNIATIAQQLLGDCLD